MKKLFFAILGLLTPYLLLVIVERIEYRKIGMSMPGKSSKNV